MTDRRHCAWLALGLSGCIAAPPAGGPAARSHGDVATPRVSARSHGVPVPLERVTAARPCPVGFDDADVVLARVGAVTLTACDVAVLDVRDVREGRAPRAADERLRALVDDVLLADEARARGLDHGAEAQRDIGDVLATGLLRDAAGASEASSDEDVAAYYRLHAGDFAMPERVHLREVVLETEAAARDAIREAGSTPFDAVVRAHTITREGLRDEGDLGLVVREGNDRVPRALADAGWALASSGDVTPDPVRVEEIETVGRTRTRTRTIVRWHVIQRMDTVPATQPTRESVARMIRHRIGFARYEMAREAARTTLLARLRASVTLDVDALRLVRLRRGEARP